MPQAIDSSSSELYQNQNRRYLWLLLITTLLIQSVMFLSYPLPVPNHDDNQAAQAYLMDELASGNLLVGNVRYHTGYAFVMAPFRALTWSMGRLGDRVFLLLQMVPYSTIPFMVYDLMRRRFCPRIAIITALVVLIDPFALQWAHFQLPGWLIALATVWALWLAQLAWFAPRRRRWALVALASVGLGIMAFARFDFAPAVAVYGLSFFLWRHVSLRQRVGLFLLTGIVSGGILVGYIFLIHVPSTKTTALSCVTAANQLLSAISSEIPLLASNGPRSRHYANLLTLPTDRDLSFYGDVYPNWRNPGSWVSELEKETFLAQPFGEAQEKIHIVFPGNLYWFLGPCESNALLYDVYREAIAKEPAKLVLGTIERSLLMLLQLRHEEAFPNMYFDSIEEIEFENEGSFGFQRAHSSQYNGHLVWRPGITLYSALFEPLNLFKLLTPFAIIAAFWRRDWVLITVAIMLLIGLPVIAALTSIEPRYYSMLAPLYSILIGWFLAEIIQRWRRRS